MGRCDPVTLDRAVDLFLGELARRGYSRRTLDDYWRKLLPMCGPKDRYAPDVSAVGEQACRAHLDKWRDSAPNTRYHSWAVLSGFFGWLYRAGVVEVNPMARIEPPKRQQSYDLDVTTVTGADVRRLFDACESWQDLLCLSTLAYLGPRRRAASNLRLRDVDLERGTVRFREKSNKTITKPIPDEYAAILRGAMTAGAIETRPDAYVIPMVRKQVRTGDRDDRVIWRTIKRLGKRARIEVHPHALRAAFAVKFLETHPGELEALQRLMGHIKIETTQIYLRRLDDQRAMERVKDLSWGLRFEASEEEAPSGFEPLYGALQAPA
jgi:integrase